MRFKTYCQGPTCMPTGEARQAYSKKNLSGDVEPPFDTITTRWSDEIPKDWKSIGFRDQKRMVCPQCQEFVEKVDA